VEIEVSHNDVSQSCLVSSSRVRAGIVDKP